MKMSLPESILCPFCGWEEVQIVHSGNVCRCFCCICEASGPPIVPQENYSTIDFIKAIERWNSRHKTLNGFRLINGEVKEKKGVINHLEPIKVKNGQEDS
jgi:hypothetical protein